MVYGNYDDNLIIMGHQNQPSEEYYETLDEINWDFIKMPMVIANSISLPPENSEYNTTQLISINVFYNIKSIIDTLDDSEIYCILDCDMVPLRKYKGTLPTDDTVVAFDMYEDWHMFIENPTKQNFFRINKYLKHTDYSFMNGGFVPILITGKNLKLIIDDVIDISINIVKDSKFEDFGWWGAMAAFQAACHNHKLKCVSDSNSTYIPMMNTYDYRTMFVHYSVAPWISKSDIESWKYDDFKNDIFHLELKKWKESVWINHKNIGI